MRFADHCILLRFYTVQHQFQLFWNWCCLMIIWLILIYLTDQQN